jgi:hypothetical protein
MAELGSHLWIVPRMRSFYVPPKYSAPLTRGFFRRSTSCVESTISRHRELGPETAAAARSGLAPLHRGRAVARHETQLPPVSTSDRPLPFALCRSIGIGSAESSWASLSAESSSGDIDVDDLGHDLFDRVAIGVAEVLDELRERSGRLRVFIAAQIRHYRRRYLACTRFG